MNEAKKSNRQTKKKNNHGAAHGPYSISDLSTNVSLGVTDAFNVFYTKKYNFLLSRFSPCGYKKTKQMFSQL